MKRIIFILLFPLFQTSIYSQDFTFGARSKSMANISSTQKDSWSVFNNIAGLAFQDETQIMASYQNQLGLKDLSTVGVAVNLPTKFGTAGLSLYRFGGDLFNQQKIGFGFANQYGLASLGIRANYLQYYLEGYGNVKSITLDFGGMAELTKKLLFGAWISNLSQQRLAQFEDERIPTIMRAGLSYRFSEQLLASVEVQKDIDYDAGFRAGLEYQVAKALDLRLGISTHPFKNYFGFGFEIRKLILDYSFDTQSFLGSNHQLSLAYSLKEKQP